MLDHLSGGRLILGIGLGSDVFTELSVSASG
jgi:alkanesulfonate monooxygenase SsuD/methylene tetrahydromethanopterin reductase-like flavin-dependent oxidoreductase (luciferase family)